MPLDRLLSTSDVVSLHVPMTPETKHLIDKKSLARMKRTAYLINTSRGPVVDEEALAWALKERLIAGAALDVYEKEPEIHPALHDRRERPPHSAPGQRHHRNPDRDGRPRGVERHRRPEWPRSNYTRPVTAADHGRGRPRGRQ